MSQWQVCNPQTTTFWHSLQTAHMEPLPLLAFASLTLISGWPEVLEQDTKTLQKDLWLS